MCCVTLNNLIEFSYVDIDYSDFIFFIIETFMKFIINIMTGLSIWFGHPIINLGRYCNASAKCADWISSLPDKSAIVRASFRMR